MSQNRNLIPPFIEDHYLRKEFAGSFEAVCLFVDISGFTQMTDALMLHGREGTEELSNILRYLFEPTVQTIYAYGGFVTTYAGDAFTALFIIEESPQQTAERAFRAALNIHQFYTENNQYESRFGSFTFGAKIGLGVGHVDWGIIGTAEKKSYYFRGQAVDDSAHAEHYAEQGEIWASNAYIELIRARLTHGASTIRSFTQIVNPKLFELPPAEVRREPPSAALSGIFSGEQESQFPEGEFREAVAIFISFENVPDLDAFIRTIFELQERYGCSHPALDFGDKGGNILLFLGAPVAYENKETRALQFITELFSLTPAPAQLRAGIAKGILYVGFYGAEIHQKFSGLGSTTNQAARFMMKAQWGQALTDESIAHNPRFQFEYLGDIDYKGRMQKIPTYALQNEASREKKSALSTSLSASFKLRNIIRTVGREKELAELEALLEPVQAGKFGGVVYIDGEAGLGKSHLVQAFKERVFADSLAQSATRRIPYKWFYLPCDEIFRKSFNPLIYFLKDYFNQAQVKTEAEKKANFEAQFDHIFQKTQVADIKHELKRTYSILGALIDLHWENSLYSQLDAKGRYENTLSAVKALIKAESLQQPLIIELEDGHWLDEGTKDFLDALTRNVNDYPFIIISACRYLDDGSRADFGLRDVPEHRLTLGSLPRNDLQTMAAHLFSKKGYFQSIPQETQDFIYERSEGNPFFIEQISLYLQEQNLLDEKLNLVQGRDVRFRVPSSINDILIARIDRLTQELKEVVKTASVLGREFAISILSAMLLKIKNGIHQDLDGYLDKGEDNAVWESISEIRYIFKHSLIRDAVYEMQLKKQLRVLHKLAAEAFEEIYRDNLEAHYFELAEHYERAQIPEKATFYLEKAGLLAMQTYRNQEAVRHFSQLLKYALPAEVEMRALYNLGNIQRDIGDWENAEKNYRLFVAASKKANDKKEYVRALNALVWLLTQKGEKDEASILISLAHTLCLESGDRYGLADTLGNKGTIEKHRGELEKARQTHTELLNLAEEIGDTKSITAAFFQLRDKLLEEENLIEIFDKYLKIAEEAGNKREMGKLLFFMGDICLLKQDYKQAEIYNRRMYEVVKETGEKRGMCYAIGDRGIVYAEQGRLEEAIACYEEKLLIAEELGDGYNIWEGQTNMGSAYLALKKYPDADKWVEKSIETSRQYELKPELFISLSNQVDVFLEWGQLQQAEVTLAEAFRLAHELGDEDFIFACELLACQVNRLVGAPDVPAQLQKLLEKATKEKRQAAIYLELWKITGEDDYREKAVERYENLYAQSKRYTYKVCLEELGEIV